MAPIKSIKDARTTTLHKLVAIRVERLGEDSRRVLQNASVIGDRFEYRILIELLGSVSDNLLSQCLKELEKFDLISEISKFPQRIFAFRSQEIAKIVYDLVPTHNKLKIHRKIGLFLETLYSDDELSLIEIAKHFLNSDDDERAIKYSIKTGEILLRQYHLRDSLNFFQKAYDLICSSENSSKYHDLKKEIFKNKWEIYLLLGNYDLALTALNFLKKLTPDRDKKENFLIQLMSSEILIEKGDFSKALTVLNDIYLKTKSNGMSDILLKSLKLLSYIHTFRENIEKAVKACEEGIFLCNDNCSEKGNFFSYLGFVEYCKNNYSGAHAYFNKAMDVFNSIDDRALIAKTFCNIGMIYFKTGDYEKASENYYKSYDLLKDIEYQRAYAITRMNLAVLYDHMGNYKKAIKEYNAVLKLSENTGNSRVLMMVFCNMGEVFTRLGKFNTSIRYLSDSVMLSKEVGSVFWELSSKLYLGICHSKLENYQEARRYINESMKLAKKLKEKGKQKEAQLELLRLDIEKEYAYAQLKEIYNELIGNVKYGISENLRMKTLELLILNRMKMKDIVSARKYIQLGLNESENCKHIEFSLVYRIMQSKHFDDIKNKDDATESLKKGRTLLKEIIETIPREVHRFYLKQPLITAFLQLLEKYNLKRKFEV